MKNKTTILTSIALMLLILVPISAFRVSAAAPPNPDTYYNETIGEPMTMDPGECYDTASIELLFNIYDPLIFWNGTSTGSFIPQIADSWWGNIVSVTDPITGQLYTQTWTFHIKSGIHFQKSDAVIIPGEDDEVDVEDVEYSFERNMVLDATMGGEWMIWDALLGLGAADLTDPLFGEYIKFAVQSNAVDKTVTFYLQAPFEPFLQILAQTYGDIMCKEWMTDTTLFADDPLTTDREDNWPGTWPDYSLADSASNNWTKWQLWHDPALSPIDLKDPAHTVAPRPHLDCALGTGPYMLDYWDKGAGGEYKLIKNPDYWGGWSSPGHVDNYVCRSIASWDTRKADLKAGTTDICVVPMAYMDQVLGYPGIRCLAGLEDLGVTSEFFNQKIAATSTFIYEIQPNGTFSTAGFCRNGFSDIKLRKAFRALFNWTQFLEAAYQTEAIQPASCVAKGLAYYDPRVVKPEYDPTLAVKLLKEAWGGTEGSPGLLWAGGFKMDFVYNKGNAARQIAAEMLRDEFDKINAAYFGGVKHFDGVPSGQEWSGSGYRLQWQSMVLPFYSVGWGADFPDAHNYVVPFMEGEIGAFARFQGFSNTTINQWIRDGINSIVPSERQEIYTKLQKAYNDNCYSFMLSQATLRRFERDWVQGWFFHPIISTEHYIYIIWKEDPVTVRRDVGTLDDECAKMSNSRSMRCKETVKNFGDTRELVVCYCTVWVESGYGGPYGAQSTCWLNAGQTKTCTVIVNLPCCTNHVTKTKSGAFITPKWDPLIIDWDLTNNDWPDHLYQPGDLGQIPAQGGWGVVDGLCDWQDLFLFGDSFIFYYMADADFRGETLVHDGVVNFWDLYAFGNCFIYGKSTYP